MAACAPIATPSWQLLIARPNLFAARTVARHLPAYEERAHDKHRMSGKSSDTMAFSFVHAFLFASLMPTRQATSRCRHVHVAMINNQFVISFLIASASGYRAGCSMIDLQFVSKLLSEK